jgi:germination protein M
VKKILAIIVLSAFVLLVFSGCSLLSQVKKISKQEETQESAAGNEETSEIDDDAASSSDVVSDDDTHGSKSGVDKNTGDDTQKSTDDSGQNKKVKKISMKLYFANKDNSVVPYEIREIEVIDGAVAKAAIKALLEGPKDKNLKKAIPDGTRLLSINKKDNVAIVDFSREYATANGIAEIVSRVSVVNTLTEIPGIEKVKILVEGSDLIGPSGEPFGELSRAELDEQGYPLPGEKKILSIYFSNSNADKVVLEKREVCVTAGQPLEKVVFEELIKGPVNKELNPAIPKGTKLISAKTKDGICTLNLSREFVDNHPGGSAGESMTINSIVNSLTELTGVNKVQFLIEGEKIEVYIHVMFSEPFSRNEAIIQK